MQLGEVYLNINTCFVLFFPGGVSHRLTFESQTQYVAEDVLKLILLPQPPEFWGYLCELPYQIHVCVCGNLRK